MDFYDMIQNMTNKEDFVKFLTALQQNKEEKEEEWENREVATYLGGICSWVEDMEGYFQNMNMEMPGNIDWKFIATLFYVGKIYE